MKHQNYSVVVKSKQVSKPVIIDCVDFDYTTSIDNHELVLLLYGVKQVHLAQTNVTEVCRIKDGVMKINGICGGHVDLTILRDQ